MKLSHRTKIAVRKALAALREAEEWSSADDPMTEHYGAGGMVADAYHDAVRRICREAGFRDPDQIEAFAKRHRLHAKRDWRERVDQGMMTPPWSAFEQGGNLEEQRA